MTSIVCIKTNEGIVIGADTQSTDGIKKNENTIKLHDITKNTILAGSGSLGLIEEVEETIEDHKKTKKPKITERTSIRTIRDIVSNAASDARIKRVEKLQKYIRYEHIPSADFIFGGYKNEPCAFFIGDYGETNIIHTYKAIGSSESFAEVILSTHYNDKMSIDDAAKLAHWAIKKASELDIYVGDKIQLKVFKKNESYPISHAQIEGFETIYRCREIVYTEMFSDGSYLLKQFSELTKRKKEQMSLVSK